VDTFAAFCRLASWLFDTDYFVKKPFARAILKRLDLRRADVL
jgi:hypothetical protein